MARVTFENRVLKGQAENKEKRYRYVTTGAGRRWRRDWPSILAEGDSWFDYPLNSDVIDHLGGVSFTFKAKSLAHRGDTVQEMLDAMATHSGDTVAQKRTAMEAKESEWVTLLREIKPRCILFSGGGNDLLVEAMGRFLRQRNTVTKKEDLIIKTRLKAEIEKIQMNYEKILDFLNGINRDLKARGEIEKVPPVIGHGYDYAIPNGKSSTIRILLPLVAVAGPWIMPVMNSDGKGNGFGISLLSERKYIVKQVIDDFNTMLERLAGKANSNYIYIDCRRTMDEDEWKDEIHPNHNGFKKVAEKFDRVIDGLP